MKKLMTGVALAALCATMTAFSADSIESTTVVGYQTVDVPAGSSMRTATFKAINGNYKISDMKVTGALGAGGDYAQKINADGTWGDMYYYFTLDGSGWLEDGWYKDDAGTAVTDADVLEVGEAMIFTAAGDFTIQFAGQVISGQPTITVPTGSSIIGNPTHANSVKISDLTVTGALGAGGDYAQKINEDGTWGDMYYYFTLDGSGWLEDGWYKDDAGTVVTDADVLNAGESMIFTAAGEFTLKFPAVL